MVQSISGLSEQVINSVASVVLMTAMLEAVAREAEREGTYPLDEIWREMDEVIERCQD